MESGPGVTSPWTFAASFPAAGFLEIFNVAITLNCHPAK